MLFWENKPFELPLGCKGALEQFCERIEITDEKDNVNIAIAGDLLVTLRTHIANYLNLLEVIFTAWNSQVGDREMIEQEFGLNLTEDGKNYPLATIVKSSKYLPSLKAYLHYLEVRDNHNIDGRTKI